MDAFERRPTGRRRALLVIACLLPAACAGVTPDAAPLRDGPTMDAQTSALPALVRLLAALDNPQHLTADRVGSALGISFDLAGSPGHAYGVLPLDGTRKANVTLYPDPLDDTRRRLRVDLPDAATCALAFTPFADAMRREGYGVQPRASKGEPEPTTFVRGAVTLELKVVGTAEADRCITQLVVR